MSRGGLIVVEGGDRCGKSTQCQKLVDALRDEGKPVEFLHFPDRETPTGKLIDAYLGRANEVEDHAVHLLFSANRWEAERKIRDKLLSGVTLVIDRYSYSGVAFSAAKKRSGLDLDWCVQPERGLPKPDVVVYLNLPPTAAAQRAAFGAERYEDVVFQNDVVAIFNRLRSSNWIEFDASQSVEDLHLEIKTAVDVVLCDLKPEIDLLWMDDDDLSCS